MLKFLFLKVMEKMFGVFFLDTLLILFFIFSQSSHIIPPLEVKFCWNSKIMPFVQLIFF